MYTCYL
jgi:hypothetical protein